MSATPAGRWHIVIVNYRTGERAARSARAARAAAGPSGTVTVVDSASGDDSLTQLAAVPGIDVCALPENRGFGAALNAGVRRSDAPFILGLNADAEIPPEFCCDCETRFDRLPALGILGPRLVGADGLPQPSARLFPTHASLLWSRRSPLYRWAKGGKRRYVLPEPPSFTLCDVVAGACFAVRRPLWQALGGMDEQFFLYLEDTDFCRRAKEAGWLVGYDPAMQVAHAWGASTNRDPAESSRRHAESLLRYLRKHYPDRPLANALFALALKVGRPDTR